MTAYKTLCKSLDRLTPFKRMVFSVALAEESIILFRHFASTKSAKLYQDAVAELWTLVRQEGDRSRSQEIRRSIELLPEANCDDPYALQYWAGRAVDAAYAALESTRGDNKRAAQLACSIMWQICGDMDEMLLSQRLSIPELGGAQASLQKKILVLLAESTNDESVVASVRQEVTSFQDTLATVLPAFATVYEGRMREQKKHA